MFQKIQPEEDKDKEGAREDVEDKINNEIVAALLENRTENMFFFSIDKFILS